jgi:hypothetical protein
MCWRCTYRTCVVRLFTISENVISRVVGEHTHDRVAKNVLAKQIASNSLKRKAREDIFSEKPSKMIHSELTAEMSSKLTSTDVRYMKNNLNRNKLKSIPKLPKFLEEVHQFLGEVEILVKTVQNENFLCINDKLLNIIVFTCPSNLRFMCSHNMVYMDGTFDCCIKYFLQLFTIFVLANAAAFCLLKDKQKKTYCNLFRLIKQKCHEIYLTFEPKWITINFEMAIHAIHASGNEIFPRCTIIGCRFHLTQSW